MVGDVVGALSEAAEPPLVGGHDLVHVQVADLGEGLQVVGERVDALHRVDRDVRRDPRQDVVPGEQPLRQLVDEAQVPGCVAGGVHGTQPPAGHVGHVAVGQFPVRHVHAGEGPVPRR
jgi:hypothetical protein